MAGSFNHITDDQGRFCGCAHLDNLGDAYEALEECYGMIWLLAVGDAKCVADAKKRWEEGFNLSPGRNEKPPPPEQPSPFRYPPFPRPGSGS